MGKNNSDDLYKKFKMRSIILTIILSLCAIACIVQMGIPVKAAVEDNKTVENSQEAKSSQEKVVKAEEKIDKERITQSLKKGVWTAALPEDKRKLLPENPLNDIENTRMISYFMEPHPFEGYIMEYLHAYDKTIDDFVDYRRITYLDVFGDTVMLTQLADEEFSSQSA